MKETKYRVYHVGEYGKEIIHHTNGEVEYPRLTMTERIEWKAKLHFDKQLEKAEKVAPDLEILPHWDLDINMDEIKMKIYEQKVKGVEVINVVNEYIRYTRLLRQG